MIKAQVDEAKIPCDNCAGRGWYLCDSPNCEYHMYFSTDRRTTCEKCGGTGKIPEVKK